VQSAQVQAGGLSQEIFNNLLAKNQSSGKTQSPCRQRPDSELPMVMQGKLDPALKTSIRKAFLE